MNTAMRFDTPRPGRMVNARMRKLKRGAIMVRCGNGPCTTTVGIAETSAGRRMNVNDAVVISSRVEAGEQPQGPWTLHADAPYLGYYQKPGDDDRTYRLITPKTKLDDYGRMVPRVTGRAAMPEGMQTMGNLEAGGKSRGIVGRFPSLPAVVVCPSCGCRNAVPVPSLAPVP